jgi:hypothetical protein
MGYFLPLILHTSASVRLHRTLDFWSLFPWWGTKNKGLRSRGDRSSITKGRASLPIYALTLRGDHGSRAPHRRARRRVAGRGRGPHRRQGDGLFFPTFFSCAAFLSSPLSDSHPFLCAYHPPYPYRTRTQSPKRLPWHTLIFVLCSRATITLRPADIQHPRARGGLPRWVQRRQRGAPLAGGRGRPPAADAPHEAPGSQGREGRFSRGVSE